MTNAATDPLSDGMRPKQRSKARLKRMAAQGYEKRPPACLNCSQYQPARHAVPGKVPYLDAHCGIGKFAVQPHAICDRWQGNSGETLE